MKNNKIYLLGACLLCAVTTFAQNVSLQPPPQQLIVQNKTIDLPAVYQLNGGEEANPHAVKVLKELLSGKQSSKKGMLISIGEKGDKSVRKYSRQIPDHKEGYYLSVNEKEIVLAGNDERGTYYALQTFAQLLKDGKLPEVEIKDYPSVRYRGVVEGFYGTPWSHQARLSQLKFYGKNKMNTYIYGPKDDPYHSAPNWRLPYPDKEAAQLQELVAVATKMKLTLYGRSIRDRISNGIRKTVIFCSLSLRRCISSVSVRLPYSLMISPVRALIRRNKRNC